MLGSDYYRSTLLGTAGDGGGGGDANKVYSPSNPSPNFRFTKDPNVNIGKYGQPITKQDMDKANNLGMTWGNFNEFSHWFGGSRDPFAGVSPVYRTYPNGQIKGGDIALLKSKEDPQIDAILSRNIAKPGEVPLFGPEDSDLLKNLITAHNTPVDYMQLVKSK